VKHLLLALLLSFPFCSNGQNELIGKTFLLMDVEAINDSKVKLPYSVMGKYTLLGLAYSKMAEEELMDWFEPFFKKFVLKTRGLLQGFGHEVNVFFIPRLPISMLLGVP
jgi:hypothetical protein